ncbi:9965_t:CDS:2 [Funneliformis geosporum]|nr:9965_t:CDS:2 [Funneliformis geosporum]
MKAFVVEAWGGQNPIYKQPVNVVYRKQLRIGGSDTVTLEGAWQKCYFKIVEMFCINTGKYSINNGDRVLAWSNAKVDDRGRYSATKCSAGSYIFVSSSITNETYDHVTKDRPQLTKAIEIIDNKNSEFFQIPGLEQEKPKTLPVNNLNTSHYLNGIFLDRIGPRRRIAPSPTIPAPEMNINMMDHLSINLSRMKI